jgi:O-methyltransferase domain/Dimerisation domain
VNSQAADVSKVFNQIMAGFGSQVVRAMALLSVAEHLADGPMTAEDIAARESTDPAASYRVLRAGVAMGLLERDRSTGTFRSTPTLEVLHQDHQNSLKHYALAAAGPVFWLPALRLPEALRDGLPQSVAALGADTWTYLGEHPELAHEFGVAMSGLSAPVIRAAADIIELGAARSVVDVGGAEGAFAAELLDRHPDLTARVLDLPAMEPRIAAEAGRRGLTDRLTAVSGDFFVAVPSADIFLLKFILHDWDDQSCVQILGAIRAAMPTGGRLYIVEMLSQTDQVPLGMAYMDIGMLVNLGGQERDLDAFDALLGQAGLARTGLTPLLEPYVAIEAMPAQSEA